MLNARDGSDSRTFGRIWRFAQFEFNESSRELLSNGAPIELESKPLDVLCQLLLHAGEVVTKEELLETVWPGVTVVEGSLATAVSKLRKALTDDETPIVLTVPRIGYRIAVPVVSSRVDPPARPDLALCPGDAVPNRNQWQLVRKLDTSLSSEVWLAQHPKTHESRVFKFASDGVRLKALKREVTLARLLKEALGERQDFVRLLEWNFETTPYYIENEYFGQNLLQWSEERGGLGRVPLQERLDILVQIAQSVADAHRVGVLHKDLKPANVLVAAGEDGHWQVKVADFGSGSLVEPAALNALGITNLGFTSTENSEARQLTGTLAYIAPEVLAGQSPTAAADIYSLGMMLYQIVSGDFRKPLSPGWESGIEDPLLREDIAAAACGDPNRRLAGADTLVDRLQTLEKRRFERRELGIARERAILAEQRLKATRARRPWVAAAVIAMAAGLAGSLILYRRALSERDRANRQTSIAAAESRFLAEDLLGRNDPFQSGKAQETLLEAVKKASPNIDRQFHDTPEVAARLHQAIARALDNRSDFSGARDEYARAVSAFNRSEHPPSLPAIVAELQHAGMEARSYQAGSLPLAKSIVAAQERQIAQLPAPDGGASVWLASARGMIALVSNDVRTAAAQFQAAYDQAGTIPAFDENTRLSFKQRLAFTSIRMGDGIRAENLFRELIATFSRINGPESTSVLRVRLNLAQALMIQGKNREAIQEINRIYPAYVEKLGPDHELTMQLLSTRAQCEGMLELWDDSIRDDMAIYDRALRKQGPSAFYTIGTLSDAALAQCRSGQYRDGERNAAKAFQSSTKAFGARAGLTGGVAYALASCWIEMKRLPEAVTLLKTIDTKAVAQLTGVPDWFANVDLSLGEIAYRQGDLSAARKYALSAAPAFSRADAEPYQKRALKTLNTSIEASQSASMAGRGAKLKK